MKEYIKPTFITAGLAPVALSALNCENKIKGDNLYALYEQFGYSEDLYGSTFAMSEADCVDAPIPDELVGACKFTSNGDVIGYAFTS